MSNLTYTRGRPSGSISPAAQRSSMTINNDSNQDIWEEDHYGFNDNNGGTHQQVTFSGNNVPAVPTTPPVLFTNTQDGHGNNLAGSIPGLFFYSGSAAQGQNNFLSGNSGSVVLFGGIIMKWGAISAAGSGTAFTNQSSPFPNAGFITIITPFSSAPSGVYNVTATTTTGFTISQGGSSNYYYIALGN
jgi:hypothetical protein